MSEVEERRPIAARKSAWALAAARRLAQSKVTPNRISQASIGFAAAASAAFVFSGDAEGGVRIILLLAAALFIQLRLLCNLFDGMVAVEGGKAQKDGAFWNEAPDRVSDILILAGAGYGPALAGVGPELGWAAAALAVLTAYVRELGRSLGAPADYGGPMAKQQRMMVVTLGAVLAAAEPAWGWSGESMTAALALVAAGSLVTVLLRSSRFIGFLRKGRD